MRPDPLIQTNLSTKLINMQIDLDQVFIPFVKGLKLKAISNVEFRYITLLCQYLCFISVSMNKLF
jgi:hypothetical protein